MSQSSRSPWLAQLRNERPHFRLESDSDCDVAVVGAGIAGVSTAYELLRHTTSRVLLIDAGRIAHGATGHNAGQVVSYFERPLPDIVKQYGVEKAVRGQVAVENAWELLENIITHCSLRTPLFRCTGYAGLSSLHHVLTRLEEIDIRSKAGLEHEQLLVRIDANLKRQIPPDLHKYLMEVPHSTVLKALATENTSFIAAEVSKKGCMNSALFCEELVACMVATYGKRLVVAEHLPVDTITLHASGATLRTHGPSVTASRVVLCTNGFENLTLINEAGPQIDAQFHSTVQGMIGYMAGYTDTPGQSVLAVSYEKSDDYHDPYHYLTRRPFEHGTGNSRSLVCIGGPERMLPDQAMYDPHSPFPAEIEEELARELRLTYRDFPPTASRAFLWHGVMGFTPNNIRRIGFEPHNRNLLYNLGCNGVGILPSMYGGKRIAQLLSGIDLEPSIFDPEASVV